MSDTVPVTFEVVNVRRIKRGVWLADVELSIDGVQLTLQGFRAVQETPTRKAIELPGYVDRGAWRPAIVLPKEIAEPLGRAIVAEIANTGL